MARLSAVWGSLNRHEESTLFQDFNWNLLAATVFAGREEPFVVYAEASYGVAIVPAALRHSDDTLRLLGEELFDYRDFLHRGEPAVLACALSGLAALRRPLEVVALRAGRRCAMPDVLQVLPFSAAPAVRREDTSAEQFAGRHGRLGQSLRRLRRRGFHLAIYRGDNSAFLRSIYRRKAAQDPRSLFRDHLRVEFLVHAALLHPATFEIYTLESGSHVAAALVTLRDAGVRRFYTGWFDAKLAKFSPANTLIYEITRQSLEAGLDCDYMTGEQPYKMRLATASVPLYRLRATPGQLSAFGGLDRRLPELKSA